MWSDVITWTTPGTDITFNSGTDVYYLDPEQCDWAVDTRLETDELSRTAGAVVFPPLKGAGHLKLGGVLAPADGASATRDSMAASLRAAADACYGTTSTISHAVRGSLTVTVEVYPAFSGAYLKSFVLVLIAADPGAW